MHTVFDIYDICMNMVKSWDNVNQYNSTEVSALEAKRHLLAYYMDLIEMESMILSSSKPYKSEVKSWKKMNKIHVVHFGFITGFGSISHLTTQQYQYCTLQRTARDQEHLYSIEWYSDLIWKIIFFLICHRKRQTWNYLHNEGLWIWH